ncbi:MAG: hypothetical protein NTW85_11300 [Methylococcales bacterium]|nr:hypothetical protein [Methylococcales bacterium]
MNILWIEDFGQLDSGVNTLTVMFQNLLSFDKMDKDSLNLIDYPNQLAEFCQQQASVHCIYLCRNYFDYAEFKENNSIVNKMDAIILDIRLNNGDHVDFDLAIPEPYKNTAEFHKNAGFYIFNDLIHLGVPAEKMCFMTGEDSTFGDFKTRCLEIYVPQIECFEKRDTKGYDKLRIWLKKQETPYTQLRRGIMTACQDLKTSPIRFNKFIKDPEKQVNSTDMHDYLGVLENFLPLRDPDGDKEEKDKKQALYKLFIRTLAHEWEAADFIKGEAWIMKCTRNWITHNSTLFNALDETMVAYLFMINMRLMFSFNESVQPCEKMLLNLFANEDLIDTEVFKNQNKNKLIPFKTPYLNLREIVSKENDIIDTKNKQKSSENKKKISFIKDAIYFNEIANNLQQSESDRRNDKVLFTNVLYQMLFLNLSIPRITIGKGKTLEITFKDFDYAKKPYLFELARYIYSRSFSVEK